MFIFLEATNEILFYVFLLAVIAFAIFGIGRLVRYLGSDKFKVKMSETEKQTVLSILEEGLMSSKICSAAMYEFEKDGDLQKQLVIIWPDSNEVAVLDLVNMNIDVLDTVTKKSVTRKIGLVHKQPDFISFFKDSVKP